MPGHRGSALAAAIAVLLAAAASAWLGGGDGSFKRADELVMRLKSALITSPIWIRHQKGNGDDFVPHCSLLGDRELVVAAERVVMPDGDVVSAAIVISRGKILRVSPISRAAASRNLTQAATLATGRSDTKILTFGRDVVVGPGVVDAHSHANEPGREEWEGLATATAAAAAGGVTTLVDMPLNSAPAATSARLLDRKAAAVDAVRARGEEKEGASTTTTATTSTATSTATATTATTTTTTTTRKGLSADVGLWAGLVPSNARNPKELRAMFSFPSVLGFKAFLSPSGIGDFDRTPVADVEAAMKTLKELKAPLVLHAELLPEHRSPPGKEVDVEVVDLESWAASRPEEMEVAAIGEVVAALERVEKETSFSASSSSSTSSSSSPSSSSSSPSSSSSSSSPSSSSSSPNRFSVHIAHVAAPTALPLISEAKKIKKLPLTAETCPHYLGHFDPLSPPKRRRNGDDDDKDDGSDSGGARIPASLLKCAPPLRPSSPSSSSSSSGALLLWRALEEGTLDLVASDHSPTTPAMKGAESPPSSPPPSFADTWGGVSGLQYLLPATFTSSLRFLPRGPSSLSRFSRSPELARDEEDRLASRVHRWLSSSPARLAGIDGQKGAIAAGLDADLVAWKPSEPADVSLRACRLKQCENSPYVETGSDLGLKGRVVATFLRGQLVFRDDGDDGEQSRLTGCGGKLVSRDS